MAADVVAYSRLMQVDEAGTLAALKSRRVEILQPLVAKHHGRVVKLMGDGVLVEFASAVDAVECAAQLLPVMESANAGLPDDRHIRLRIGINLGDVIVEGGDLYGDGVNIAARLEAVADPGGVVVSRTVFNHVRGKVNLGFDDLGEQHLKNIAEPVRVYRLRSDGEAMKARPALQLPDRPSIAVLPFQNLSGDPEQEYFADGMVEEIITALSRMRWLFVMARNSSFTYKGRAVDVKQVGRELGVRYVLEGSLRKSGNKVRIAGQLIDCSTGAHLWADRFDGAPEDIFDLQDQVTSSVVGAIAPKLEQAEIDRSKRKTTESLDAYDYYLRGLAAVRRDTEGTVDKARELFLRATELDSDFASAYAMAAWCYVRRKANGWMTDREKEKADTAQIARRAVELGKDDAIALTYGGFSLAYVVGDLDDGAAIIDRAVSLNPNLAVAWSYSGWIRAYRGELQSAIEHQVRAMRLSPLDALMYNMQGGAALAHFLAGRNDQAAALAEEALRNQPAYLSALRILAASRALMGQPEEAQRAVARLCRVDPASRVSNLLDRIPLRRPEDVGKFADALRQAGLPE